MSTDVFADAKASFTIADAWHALGLPGAPRATCRTPWRDDRNPSFSIFDGGKAWKDHATGECGDVVAFVMRALDIDHAEARLWFMERLGIDRPDPVEREPEPVSKAIEWPGEWVKPSPAITADFAERRSLTYAGAHTLIEAGLVRFLKADAVPCYAVTDPADKAGEIRRMDGGTWNGRKQYPLRGVQKSWPVGGHYLRGMRRDAGAIIAEGATDFLHLVDHFTAMQRANRSKRAAWLPLAILGAGCKDLHPELVPWMRGRPVRLIPDGDDAGDMMAQHWAEKLGGMDCRVSVVRMPRGEDLRSMSLAGRIQPGELLA